MQFFRSNVESVYQFLHLYIKPAKSVQAHDVRNRKYGNSFVTFINDLDLIVLTKNITCSDLELYAVLVLEKHCSRIPMM